MSDERTGVGEYVYELLKALFEIDRENQYFLFYNSSKDVSKNIPKWNYENVHYVKTKWPNKLFNFSLHFFKRPGIDKIIIKKNKDKIKKLDYFFSPNINFLSLSKKIKHILTIHDLSFEFFPDCFCAKRRLWHKILSPKTACEKADIILTPSENTKRDIVNKYDIDTKKIFTIYPGLCPDMKETNEEEKNIVKEKYNLPSNFILFLGTVEPRKNIVGIINAFKQLYELRPNNYRLIIAGAKGWHFGPIMDLISKSNNVQYIGYVDAKDKPSLYKLADLFVYPSLYEGFGFPILEAMSVGTPVVTSNRSSLVEVAGNGAYLVNPNNISEIAKGMEYILYNEKVRELICNKAKDRVERFNWKKTAQEFLELINVN
jgi:glycosyltransferase involved in cell wall biosynthesis